VKLYFVIGVNYAIYPSMVMADWPCLAERRN